MKTIPVYLVIISRTDKKIVPERTPCRTHPRFSDRKFLCDALFADIDNGESLVKISAVHNHGIFFVGGKCNPKWQVAGIDHSSCGSQSMTVRKHRNGCSHVFRCCFLVRLRSTAKEEKKKERENNKSHRTG
jgi:hypothetical protein